MDIILLNLLKGKEITFLILKKDHQNFQEFFSLNQKVQFTHILTSTSTSNTWMAREILGLFPTAPLSKKIVRIRNDVGHMLDTLQVSILHILCGKSVRLERTVSGKLLPWKWGGRGTQNAITFDIKT